MQHVAELPVLLPAWSRNLLSRITRHPRGRLYCGDQVLSFGDRLVAMPLAAYGCYPGEPPLDRAKKPAVRAL